MSSALPSELNPLFSLSCTWKISDFSHTCHTLLSISCIHFTILFLDFFIVFLFYILTLHIHNPLLKKNPKTPKKPQPSEVFIPVFISKSFHLLLLYEKTLINFFIAIFSSSYLLYFSASIPVCFDGLVIFSIFIYVSEVNTGELVGPSCAQTWRLPFPSSNSDTAFSLVGLSKYEHGILQKITLTQLNCVFKSQSIVGSM